VQATFNNTKIAISDLEGDVICWASAGSCGFSGTRKSTPFAAQRAGEQVAREAKNMGVREIEVKVKGPGAGRESAISALESSGLVIHSIEDATPLPHNGCRPPKRRRV
jgi:small subunit ribosomal protein S11